MHWGTELALTFRVVHVLFAATWLGFGVAMNFLIGPILKEATMGTRREITGRLGPASMRFGNIVGGFTILTGLALLYVVYDGFDPGGELSGRLIFFSFIASLAALYLLNFAMRPTMKAIQKLMTDQPPNEPPPQAVLFLLKRTAVTGFLMFVVVLVAFVAMLLAAHPL